MRRIVDIACVAAVVSAALGGWMWLRAGDEEEAVIDSTREAVERLQHEVRYRAGSGMTETNARGWPVEIEASWFAQGEAPRNELLSLDRPWVEIAPLEQMNLQDPPDRIAIDRTAAAFWYNPALGVVRARVPAGVSDRRTMEIYNIINGTRLASIFDTTGTLTGEEKAFAGVDDGALLGEPTGGPAVDAIDPMDPTVPRRD